MSTNITLDATTDERSPPPAYSWFVLVILTCLSGMFSGLNLGLMSLTVEDLNIIVNSSKTQKQISDAKRILPLRKHGNLLLCTLLIGNTVVNVMLAVVTDPCWVFLFGTNTFGSVMALVVPSALIVVFGEIVPQSVCSRYALSIGAKTIYLTYIFLALTFIAAYPISLILDKVLGDEISGVYTRQGLFELIKLNIESIAHNKENDLTQADGRLLMGALQFKDTVAGFVMTPLSRVFSLPETAVLDGPTVLRIVASGHTRVPIYRGDDPSDIVALLYVKDICGIGFERQMLVKTVCESFHAARRVHRISSNAKLNVALDRCKKLSCHLLIVCDEVESGRMGGESGRMGSPPATPAASSSTPPSIVPADASDYSLREPSFSVGGLGMSRAVGVISMEDILEEILQEEIVDETDVYVNNETDMPMASREKSRTRELATGLLISCGAREKAAPAAAGEVAYQQNVGP